MSQASGDLSILVPERHRLFHWSTKLHIARQSVERQSSDYPDAQYPEIFSDGDFAAADSLQILVQQAGEQNQPSDSTKDSTANSDRIFSNIEADGITGKSNLCFDNQNNHCNINIVILVYRWH